MNDSINYHISLKHLSFQLDKFIEKHVQNTSPKVNKPIESSNKSDLDEIPNSEKLQIYLNAKSKLEKHLLMGKTLTNSNDHFNSTTCISLNQLKDYAERISGSTCAPPETQNITDPVLHHSIYPNYHFLNFVSHEEILRSRLWDIITWNDVCFPPIISFEHISNSNSIKLIITCSTPKTTIFFRILDSVFIKYDPNKLYLLENDNKFTIYAYSAKANYKDSRLVSQDIKS